MYTESVEWIIGVLVSQTFIHLEEGSKEYLLRVSFGPLTVGFSYSAEYGEDQLVMFTHIWHIRHTQLQRRFVHLYNINL